MAGPGALWENLRDVASFHSTSGRGRLGLLGFWISQQQFPLSNLSSGLSRIAAELHPAQLNNDQLQIVDPGIAYR